MTQDAQIVVPHLTTALSGPLQHIESVLLDKQSRIETWLRREWQSTPAPIYGSVDLRNAGFKLAPVDTNLFPAGFNNLNPSFHGLAVQALQTGLERVCAYAKNLLLVPENHTRNLFYMENVATLVELIEQAGYSVRVGTLRDDISSAHRVDLPSGRRLMLEPLLRKDDRLGVANFIPCAILLNNDLSGGRPAILEGLKQQVIPPLDLGWSNRTKTEHFTAYKTVAEEFAALVDVDSWLIDPMFRNCGEVNFKTGAGADCLESNVDKLLTAIEVKYKEYGIDREPFVIIKADSGTYGMGIMTAKSPDDVKELNRKQRNRMSSAKDGRDVSRVLIQEGVYTFEELAGSPAEPVVYMVDRSVVGGFYRVHKSRGTDENLNAPGMHFEPLAFDQSLNSPDRGQEPDARPNRFYAYGVVARLALLAAAREIADSKQQPAVVAQA